MRTTTKGLLLIVFLSMTAAQALILTPLEVILPSDTSTSPPRSSSPYFSFLTAASWLDSSSTTVTDKTISDRVVRVMEDTTIIKLEKTGLVSLAGLQFPKKYTSNGSCPTRTTSTYTKLQQLLPPNTAVWVYPVTEKDDRGIRKVLLFRSNNKNNPLISIQTQLLLRNYATVRDADIPALFSQELKDEWRRAEDESSNDCRSIIETEFESLRPSLSTKLPPKNPGDSKGCSDFATYEDALRWYERYFPLYGDVAKLDRDHDGIPCPGLPHTSDPELYRRKVPLSRKQ